MATTTSLSSSLVERDAIPGESTRAPAGFADRLREAFEAAMPSEGEGEGEAAPTTLVPPGETTVEREVRVEAGAARGTKRGAKVETTRDEESLIAAPIMQTLRELTRVPSFEDASASTRRARTTLRLFGANDDRPTIPAPPPAGADRTPTVRPSADGLILPAEAIPDRASLDTSWTETLRATRRFEQVAFARAFGDVGAATANGSSDPSRPAAPTATEERRRGTLVDQGALDADAARAAAIGAQLAIDAARVRPLALPEIKSPVPVTTGNVGSSESIERALLREIARNIGVDAAAAAEARALRSPTFTVNGDAPKTTEAASAPSTASAASLDALTAGGSTVATSSPTTSTSSRASHARTTAGDAGTEPAPRADGSSTRADAAAHATTAGPDRTTGTIAASSDATATSTSLDATKPAGANAVANAGANAGAIAGDLRAHGQAASAPTGAPRIGLAQVDAPPASEAVSPTTLRFLPAEPGDTRGELGGERPNRLDALRQKARRTTLRLGNVDAAPRSTRPGLVRDDGVPRTERAENDERVGIPETDRTPTLLASAARTDEGPRTLRPGANDEASAADRHASREARASEIARNIDAIELNGKVRIAADAGDLGRIQIEARRDAEGRIGIDLSSVREATNAVLEAHRPELTREASRGESRAASVNVFSSNAGGTGQRHDERQRSDTHRRHDDGASAPETTSRRERARRVRIVL